MNMMPGDRIGDCDTLEEFVETFPMRPPVLLMAENDPAVMDVEYWIDLFRRTRADAVTLAAGGYVAYYPTDVPYHHRSAWLRDGQDLLGDLVERCRGLGMKYIFARTDAHAVHDDARAAHPEWVAVDEHGEQRRHWAHSGAWLTCSLGPYMHEFMNAVHREIVLRYDVDFIFCNRWSGSAVCYCDGCRALYRAATGDEIPVPRAARGEDDDAFAAFAAWRREQHLRIAREWNRQIRDVRPGARFIPNAGGGALSPYDMVELADSVPFLIADRQSRPEGGAHWANGKNAKEFRAVMGRKPVLAGVNVGLCGRHRWMDSAKDPWELHLWLCEAVAHGMVPRYTKHSGVVYDRTWERPVVEFFSWLASVEPYLRNVEPVADVAMVYSQQTGRSYGRGRGGERVEAPILGFYQGMVESRIPFEMVHDRLLDEEHLARFRTLVLPNVAALSDAQCEQLRAFVARGGGLVASWETSLYDERGTRRDDFGLADLFGASAAGPSREGLRNTYLNVEPLTGGDHHPVVEAIADRGRIIGGTNAVPVRATATDLAAALTFAPGYPDLPMEELYPRAARGDEPAVLIREAGRGRVVFYPWDIGRVFWDVLHGPHLALIRGAIEWANRDSQPVRVVGAGVIDVAVWRQRRSYTVNLVNLTNPMMMRGAYRSITPVHGLRLTVRLGAHERVERVRLLREAEDAAWERSGDGPLTVDVPRLDTIEIVAVDLA